MNATNLTPASRAIILHLGKAWLSDTELSHRSRLSRGDYANGIRELVRDELIETKFVPGKKLWRAT
jgi:DNA-binding transcriptional regulator GbsR (MarR family)